MIRGECSQGYLSKRWNIVLTLATGLALSACNSKDTTQHEAQLPSPSVSTIASPKIMSQSCDSFDILELNKFAVAKVTATVLPGPSAPYIPIKSLEGPAQAFIFEHHGCDGYFDNKTYTPDDVKCSQDVFVDPQATKTALECIVQLGHIATEPIG